MGKWNGGRLTAKARAAEHQAKAYGKPLIFTRLELGEGEATPEEMDSRTSLVMPRYNMPISSRSAEDGVCHISGIAFSAKNQVGFYVTELGLYALDPLTDEEFLYIYAIDDIPDYLPKNSATVTTSAAYALAVVISNIENINIQIDPNGLVSVKMLADAANIIGRQREYRAGDIVNSNQLAPGLMLQCIKSGVTGESEIAGLGKLEIGSRYLDGTVVWAVVKIITTAEDRFVRTAEGNITLKEPIYDPAAPVRFVQDLDGTVRAAGREFYSYMFMYNERGGIVMRPENWRDKLNPDDPALEDDNNTADEDDGHNLFDKLLADLNAQQQK